MTFIPKKSDISRRVRLIKPITCLAGTFTVGHEFTIVGESNRGHDLRDDAGNDLIECGLHRSHYKFVEELEADLQLQAKMLGIDAAHIQSE